MNDHDEIRVQWREQVERGGAARRDIAVVPLD
jgi:hypothetical protein